MAAFPKTLFIAVLGLIFAVFLGTLLGSSDWLIPLSITGAVVLFFAYTTFSGGIKIEALILGFLLIGYTVGNRGFAQISLASGSPIYFGEVGMVLFAAIYAGRQAITRERLFPKTPLSYAIIAFLLLGAIRLYADTVFRVSGSTAVTAIRDSATVYYAVFFFVAYKIGQNENARRFVERCILIAFLLLIPVLILQFTTTALYYIRIRGFPLIAHKNDLLCGYMGIGSFYFFLKSTRGFGKIFWKAASILAFVGMLLLLSRAAFLGFACAAGLLIVAGRPQLLIHHAVLGGLALICVGILQVSNVRWDSDYLTVLSDKIVSMTDLSGTRRYQGAIGEMSSANNQYRTVWWGEVFKETMEKGPIFGLGFGYDLAANFLRTYYAGQIGDFNVRSPHSIALTVLGRMGIVGLLSFFTISFLIVREAVAAARRVARKRAEVASLAHWCAVLSLLASAMFGVVLEGPMGGILFWSFLGLAASQIVPPPSRRGTPAVPNEARRFQTPQPSLPAGPRQLSPVRG